MEVTIQDSQVWWEPFLKQARATVAFKRFCIGSCGEYEKYVRSNIIEYNGRFFYARIDNDRLPTAVTAVSLVENVLHVHFYWTGYGHPETYPLFSKIFSAAYDHFMEKNFKYVLFPVPQEYLGSWHLYAERLHDGYGRQLVWYKFQREDFATFGKLTAKHRAQSLPLV